MINKLKNALFFVKGSKPSAEEIETAKAIELKHMLSIRLRNASAFKATNSPEPTDAICGTITEAIKRTYPATPIITLDGSEPVIQNDKPGNEPAGEKTVDAMTVDELVSYVASKGYEITGFSSMNKADKVAAIKATEEALANPAPAGTQPNIAPENGGWQ